MQELFQQVITTLRGMWKFRWPGLIAAWVAALVGAVVVWRIPDQYEATARIYVDTESILKPLMSGLTVQPNVEQQISMLSRTLLSRPNIDKLIRMADLDLKSMSKRDQDTLADRLMQGVEIRTGGGANLYSMAYRDTEPDKAKRVVQSLVSIFVESGLGASRKDTDSAKTFLGEQIKSYEQKLEEAETRMKEFRLRNLSMQSGDGKDATTRLGEISRLLEQAKLDLHEAENSRDAARAQLKEEKAGSGGIVSSLLEESATQIATPDIDARIDAQKRNIDQLLQRYTEAHPDIVYSRKLLRDLEDQKKREVAELRKAAANRPTSSSTGSGGSLATQELGRLLAASEVQVAGLKARVAEFSARYAAAKEALKTAPQIEAEAAQLNRDYAITKKNYEDLVARRQSAVMSGELDVASGVADFRLVDPPRVAPKPVSPNRPLLLPIVLAASLALGLAVSFVGFQLRPTFSSPEDLRLKTGLPLLGVVTMLTSEADRRRERTGLFRWVAASGGLVGVFVAAMIAVTLMSRYGG